MEAARAHLSANRRAYSGDMLWRGPGDPIDCIQQPLTGSTFYRVDTLPRAGEATRVWTDVRPFTVAGKGLIQARRP